MSWPVARIGDHLMKLGSGVTPRGGDSVYVDDGTALIRSQNIHNNRFQADGLVYIDEDQAIKMRGVAVHADDVLLNITGDSVARCCKVSDDVLPARVNQHVMIIRPNPNDFDPDYLTYQLTSPFFQMTLLSIAGSGGTRKALTKAMIERLEIPKPEIGEQRRIAGILSAYDKLIDNNLQRIELLEETARQLYKEWFVRFRFPGHEHVKITDGVPEGWERLPLGEVLMLQRGFDLPVSDRMAGTVPVYGSTGIVGYHDTAKVSAPTLTTGRSGSLGQVCFISIPCWPLNTALWVREFKRASAWFAYFLLSEMALEKFNGGASVPTLDRNVAHAALVILPSFSLLQAFDEAAKPNFELIDNLIRQNGELAKARDLLLPKLMSGAIAV